MSISKSETYVSSILDGSSRHHACNPYNEANPHLVRKQYLHFTGVIGIAAAFGICLYSRSWEI